MTSANLVVWRDEASRAWAGRGTVAPDWAFSLGSEPDALKARHEAVGPVRVILSLRGDRPEPSPEAIDELRSTLASTGATPVVICQVRRDGDRSAWLARELDGELVPWPAARSHAEQEAVLRAEYSHATWVVSDRLHVLIAAMTEGAVPLAAVPDTTGKVARTLAGLDLVPVVPVHAADRLPQSRDELRSALAVARARLVIISERIADIVEGRPVPRQLRVLHSMPAPDATTRYATHMAATEDLTVRPVFFTWTRALLGSYDRFHLHWPEHLVPGGGGLRIQIRRALAAMVIGRIARRRIPALRTLHNLTPHDASDTDTASRLHRRLDTLTRVDIHLVDGDPIRPGVDAVLIPHGSYREPYAVHPLPARTEGRVLFFGMLKRYKGVAELLEAFQTVSGGSLRIVGAPADHDVVEAVRRASANDPRVTAEFGFIADAALAAEIGAAELVALPYHELHSSGVVLVALSLARPVLVRRTATTEALMREVGPDWVRLYDGALAASELSAAQSWAARASHALPPNLTGRSWSAVRAQHGVAYAALDERQR
ncbi:MAG: glycosyltransferase [Rhodoglobus sp.]